MRIHFIAIGGSAMHNLAIALKNNGDIVTGSDDEIFEPSASRLKKHNIYPQKMGWDAESISPDIDIVILGMHARKDNPELLKAKELNLKIVSYPEFLFSKTKNKKRIVIGGSHGKTTVTSMIMHVLKELGISFDYMVGANIQGFDTMVNLEEKNDLAIFEGDEYLSSPIDLRPKFHWYKPHLAVLTGIAWDHINVFPTFENYLLQFGIFINSIDKKGKLFYYKNDKHLSEIVSKTEFPNAFSYIEHPSQLTENQITIKHKEIEYSLNIFGKHNLQNLNAAFLICQELGINPSDFFEKISYFKGAAKRLQLLGRNDETEIFLDFAHAPSKVKATVEAMKDKNPNKKLVACLELHTFSSLKRDFLPGYKNTMQIADEAIVYYNPQVIEHKKLEPIDAEFVKKSFGGNISIYQNSSDLQEYLLNKNYDNTDLLIMSSGNFNGINFTDFADKILNK